MDQIEELQNKIAELEARSKKAETELEILKRTYYLQLRGQTSSILVTFLLLGIGIMLAAAVHFDYVK